MCMINSDTGVVGSISSRCSGNEPDKDRTRESGGNRAYWRWCTETVDTIDSRPSFVIRIHNIVA